MYEFPGEGRKAGVQVPPWNPLEGRPWLSVSADKQLDMLNLYVALGRMAGF